MAELRIGVSLPGEISETTDSKSREEALHATQPIPSTTGSFANATQLGFWKKMGDDGQLNGGLFRSGDLGTTVTPYASYLKNFFKLDQHHGLFSLHSKIDGGFGGYVLIPDRNVSEDYAPGFIPSIRGFLGAEQRILGFKLREGIEQAAAIPLGKRQGTLPNAPLTAGASIGRQVRSAHFSLGMVQHWYLTASDVQDQSLAWNRDHVSTFFNITLPGMAGQVGMDYFRNESRLKIQLSKLFPMLGGTGSFSLAADVATKGQWSSVDHGTFLLFGFSGADRGGNQGVFLKTAVDIRQKPGETYEPAFYKQNDTQKWDPYTTMRQTRLNTSQLRFSCEKVSGHDEGNSYSYYECDIGSNYKDKNLGADMGIEPGSKVYCNENKAGDTLSCQVGQYDKNRKNYDNPNGYKEYSVQFELKREVNDPYSLYLIQGHLNIQADENTPLALMQQSPSLGSFIQALKTMPDDKKMEALNMLARMAYATFDNTGLDFAFGNDRINSIGRDEIYQTVRDQIFDPGKTDKTTVCRGIAKMIASVANDLGYESHAIALNAGKILHVVTALRKYGEEFSFINYGNGTENTYSRKLEEALLVFAHNNGYPPQLQFVVFDHNGRYERTLITNEGRLLQESTTPPSVLDGFLRF